MDEPLSVFDSSLSSSRVVEFPDYTPDQLLEIFDRLKDVIKLAKIKVPIIATCGMQSHGKSSTLESITHISLPQGEGTKTLCPIKISLRNLNEEEEEYARIKYGNENEENYKKISLSEIGEKIDEYQEKIKNKNNKNKQLFDKVIQVEVNRINVPNLTLYDLPGINFDKNIQEKSKEINRKYLKKEESTVLLILSGTEEVTNSAAIDLMREIKNYQNKFNVVITKADMLKNKNMNECFNQIKKLELKNPPSIIINKCGEFKDLSYEEMEKKEEELINNIPNINNYPLVNKGIKSLVKHLTKIQQESLIYKHNYIIF